MGHAIKLPRVCLQSVIIIHNRKAIKSPFRSNPTVSKTSTMPDKKCHSHQRHGEFSSQIKKMSKKPLKYNPEEVMVMKVDMAQDMFNFAMDTTRASLGKFKKEDEPGMAKHCVDMFNAEFGEHWMSVVGDNFGIAVNQEGNFAHFHMGPKEFVIYKAA